MLHNHRSTQADITVACLPVDEERASGFCKDYNYDLLKIDSQFRIRVSL